MTKKVYRSAMGKTVDMGALLLQNENVRAVGNMNVNARGDILDSNNRVIEKKEQQVKRQYRRQTNVSSAPVTKSVRTLNTPEVEEVQDTFSDLPEEDSLENAILTPPENIKKPAVGGLAAAIAKSQQVRQELEKPINSKPTSIRKI